MLHTMKEPAQTRFRDNANLMRQVLTHLDRAQLAEVAPALLPHVAGILHSRMEYDKYKWLISCKTRWVKEYLGAVRVIDASYTPKVLARDASTHLFDLFSPEGIAEVRLHCPKAHTIIRLPTDDDLASQWKVELDEKGGGQVWVSYARILDPESDATTTRASFVPPAPWPGFEMHVKYFAILRSSMAWDESPEVIRRVGNSIVPGQPGSNEPMPIAPWLGDMDKIDDKIDRLALGHDRIASLDLKGILASRQIPVKTLIRELHIHYLPRMTTEMLGQLGSEALGLEKLRIDHIQTSQRAILDFEGLAEFVTIIRRNFLDLKELDITLQQPMDWQMEEPYDERDMPAARMDYDGRMDKITLRFPCTGSVLLGQRFPTFTFARNLACLGGPGCEYTLKCSDPFDKFTRHLPKDLVEQIHRLQALPPHHARGIQEAERFDIFDSEAPRSPSLDTLGWKVTGQPISAQNMRQVKALRESRRAQVLNLQSQRDHLDLTLAHNMQARWRELEAKELARCLTDYNARRAAWEAFDPLQQHQRMFIGEGEVDWEDEDEADLPRFIERTVGAQLTPREEDWALENFIELTDKIELKAEIEHLQSGKKYLEREVDRLTAEVKQLYKLTGKMHEEYLQELRQSD